MNNDRRLPIIGAAVAALAAGLLQASPMASALPPLPLVPPDCVDYIYPSSFEVMQDNNVLTAINNNGNRFDGPGASYTQVGAGGGDTRGTSTGVRNGRDITIDVTWNNGLTSHLSGKIEDDLVARGTIVNNQGASNTWHSLAKFKCVPPATPPVDAKPEDKPDVKPDPLSATITQESTVYDAPDGNEYVDPDDNVVVFLSPGPVKLVEHGSEDWCHVFTDQVPGGQGSIYRKGFVTVP